MFYGTYVYDTQNCEFNNMVFLLYTIATSNICYSTLDEVESVSLATTIIKVTQTYTNL